MQNECINKSNEVKKETREEIMVDSVVAVAKKAPVKKQATPKAKPKEAVEPSLKAEASTVVQVETTDENISEEELDIRTRSDEYNLGEEARESTVEQIAKDKLMLCRELRKNKQFHSLSMPQIGVKGRMFVIRHKNDMRAYINPIVIDQRGLFVAYQIDEAMPEKKYVIFRPTAIDIAYCNDKGVAKETTLEGLSAAEFVKQLERLEGIMIWDMGEECDCWETKSEENKQRFIGRYLERLSREFEETEAQLETDDELKTAKEAYEQAKESMREELVEAMKENKKEKERRLRRIKAKQDGKYQQPWDRR